MQFQYLRVRLPFVNPWVFLKRPPRRQPRVQQILVPEKLQTLRQQICLLLLGLLNLQAILRARYLDQFIFQPLLPVRDRRHVPALRSLLNLLSQAVNYIHKKWRLQDLATLIL